MNNESSDDEYQNADLGALLDGGVEESWDESAPESSSAGSSSAGSSSAGSSSAESTSPEDLQKFVDGEMTWGELQGLTMEQAYAMAEVAFGQFEAGRHDEAQAIFEGLVVSNPYDAYFHSMLGATYVRKNMHAEAAEEFTIAIDLDPDGISPLVSRAEILLQHGEFDAALVDLNAAIALDPDAADPAGIRARTLASATKGIVDEILSRSKGKA